MHTEKYTSTVAISSRASQLMNSGFGADSWTEYKLKRNNMRPMLAC